MSNPPHQVVVIGNIGIDTNVYFYGNEPDFSVESNFTQNIDYIGQAGGYTSRGYAQLGIPTAFIGSVGDDFSGRFIHHTLQQDGINTDALFIDPAGTARSINFMYADGRRKNFYDGKGHMTLLPDFAACENVFAGAKLAHFHLADWGRHLLTTAKALGLKIAVDLQDVVHADDPYRADFVAQADVLFFSAVNTADPAPLMHAFAARNPHALMISGMGSRGCALWQGGNVRYFSPVELPQPVVDTNGAGDGLAVGFLSSYFLDGYDLETAILRGQITARYTCGIKASTDGLISRDQLDQMMQNLR